MFLRVSFCKVFNMGVHIVSVGFCMCLDVFLDASQVSDDSQRLTYQLVPWVFADIW